MENNGKTTEEQLPTEALDEPIFSNDKAEECSVKSKSKNKYLRLGYILLAFSAVVIVIALLSKQDPPPAQVAEPVLQVNAVSSENLYDIKDGDISIVNEAEREVEDGVEDGVETEQVSENDSDELNILLLAKLAEIKVSQNDLISRLDTIESGQVQLTQKLGVTDELLKNEFKKISLITKSLGKDGLRRDKALSELLTAVNGFKVDINERKFEFPLEILHSEIWSGRKRVVAFKPSSPRYLIKIYEGEEFEGWKLVSVNKTAKFKHVEADKLVEVDL